LTWIKRQRQKSMQKMTMRASNDGKRTERRRNGTAATPLQGNHALGLARGFGAAGLRTTLGWQIARTLFRIGFAGALAVFAGRLIEDDAFDVTAISGALACLALSAFAGVFGDLAAAGAEERVVNRLRAALQDALSSMSPVRIRTKPAGALVAGLQRYPDALAGLVISHSAAKSMLAIGPLLAALAVALVSWEAALTLFVMVPVMVIFFVLLGGVVRDRAEAQEKAFGRLAAQFSDRIRTLPTILANHALLREHDKIEQRMTLYAESTMAVLKVAFLNAGIIDFFSAIAIALLAVLLGLSHLGLMHVPGFSGLALWQSLFILIIAAEFFTPFRRYAEQYHVKAEGQAAAKELGWYFDEAAEATAGNTKPFTVAGAFDVSDLPPAGLIAISGPSGAGKSTLLRRLAGIETPPPDFGSLPQITAEGCDWISTDIYVPAGTLAEAISWRRGSPERAILQAAALHVGLLDERLLPGGLDARIAEGGDNLSGGQRMRVGIARIMLSGGVVLADEPTAKLDPQTAKLARQVLTDIAKQRLVIVATHDEQLIEAASRHHVLRLPPPGGQAVAA
jgi:ABC-type transport system involved in cytochrome bd biosynthesis fused ATPase/permease subunit